MKNKKIILILAILITFFLVASTINAAENNTKNTKQEIKKHTQSTENTKTATPKTIYVSIYGNDNNGQGTTTKPYKTLTKAVTQTNNNDNIILMPGTHTLTNTNPIQINKNIHIKGQDKNKVAIKSYGSSNDLININKQVTLQISNLQFKQSNNIKSLINNNGKLILNNVNFQQNSITESWNTKALINNQGTLSLKNTQFAYNIGNKGSAIYNTGSVYIQSSTLKFNKANFGGAIYNQQGTIIIKDSTINANQAYPSENLDWNNDNYVHTGGLGAAIYNKAYMEIHNSAIEWNKIVDGPYRVQRGAIYSVGTLIVKKSILTHNDIAGTGGAIYSTSKLIISDSQINNNKATYSGAMQIMKTSNIKNTNILGNKAELYGGAITNNGNLEITNTKIQSNEAVIHGGAIINTNKITMTKCNLINNKAGAYGGAIESDGKLTITSSNLKQNKAFSGGAIYNHNTLILRSSTLSNNNAEDGGGAIASEGTINIDSSTLYNNVAKTNENAYGGAIHVIEGTTKVTNSKVNQNTARYGGAIGIWEGKLILTNTQLNNNYATESGGVISSFVHEEGPYYQTIEINKCNINNNNAKYAQIWDGGNMIAGGSKTTIKNSVFTNNGKKAREVFGKVLFSIEESLKIYNSKFTSNSGCLISGMGELIIDSSTVTDNKAPNELIYISGMARITNTKIKNNVAKWTLKPVCAQGSGNLVISKSVLYNPKAKLEINNKESVDGITNNVKCDNNWWGTKSKPTYRVAQCVIRSYYKGLK